MDRQQAIEIIKKACASVMGNLADHQTIQEAITIIEKELETIINND